MSVELNQATSSFSSPRSSKCGLITKGLKVALGLMKDLFYTNLSTLHSTSQDLGERVLVPRSEAVITQTMAPSTNTNYAIEDSDDDSEIEHSDDEVSDVCGVNNDLVDPHASEQGLIYAIYSPETETLSYLIGTNHKSTSAALNNRYLPSIIDKCEMVYTEKGAAYREVEEPGEPIEPFTYDSALEASALQKNKQLVGLDRRTGVVLAELEYLKKVRKEGGEPSHMEKLFITYNDPTEPVLLQEKFMKELEILLSDPDFEDSLDAWQRGDAKMFAALKEKLADAVPIFYQRAVLRREKVWMEELSQSLETSKTPICIAVGAAHLVGKDGLVAQLQKKGFDVYQTTFSDCVNDNFFFDD